MDKTRDVEHDMIIIYVGSLEQQKAQENLEFYLENRTGAFITLGNSPNIMMNRGATIRDIIAYSAVYRKGDTTKYCAYEEGSSISGSNNNWKILLINEFTEPKLYILDGDTLVFFPEESIPMNSADFVEISYKTKNYQGIIHLCYINGKPSVFSEATTSYYGNIYGKIINEMTSLAVDIHVLQKLLNLQKIENKL